MFIAECHYAECHYTECRYAKCHYAQCHYAERRGALGAYSQNFLQFVLMELKKYF